MTRKRLMAGSALAAAAMLVAGCLQPSLHPLIRPADSIFDDRLVGPWTCGSETWTFAPEAEGPDGATFRHYKVSIRDDRAAATLRAWIGRLGTTAFINFFPDGDDRPAIDFFSSHLVAAHTFGRLRIGRDAVDLDMLDSEWIENTAKGGRFALGVTGWSGDGVLLTAPTDELQAFARAHVENAQVFGEHLQLVRKGGREAGECL